MEGESSTLSKIHVGDLACHGMGLFWDLKVICQGQNLQKILIYISNKTCLNNRRSLDAQRFWEFSFHLYTSIDYAEISCTAYFSY